MVTALGNEGKTSSLKWVEPREAAEEEYQKTMRDLRGLFKKYASLFSIQELQFFPKKIIEGWSDKCPPGIASQVDEIRKRIYSQVDVKFIGFMEWAARQAPQVQDILKRSLPSEKKATVIREWLESNKHLIVLKNMEGCKYFPPEITLFNLTIEQFEKVLLVSSENGHEECVRALASSSLFYKISNEALCLSLTASERRHHCQVHRIILSHPICERLSMNILGPE